jgi:hypothetical protein
VEAVELTMMPLVPVIVIEASPKATAFVAVSVSVEVFPEVLLGLKLPETPEGSPDTLIVTEAVNPGARLRVTSMVLLAPGTSTCGLGLATTAKLPVGLHSADLRARVYGPNLMISVLARAKQEKLPVYLYGSSPDVLSLLITNLQQRFPGLIIAGVSPSTFGRITPEAADRIGAQIRESGAWPGLPGRRSGHMNSETASICPFSR